MPPPPTSPDMPPPGLYVAPAVSTRNLPTEPRDAFLADNIAEILAAATRDGGVVVLENRLNVTRRNVGDNDGGVGLYNRFRYRDDFLREGHAVIVRDNANGVEQSILPIVSNHRALNVRVLAGLYLTNSSSTHTGTAYTAEFNREKWQAPVYARGPCTDRAVRLGVSYAFDKMKTAVLVRVVAGRVATFLPLFNVDGYTNDFADLIRFDAASGGDYAGFVKLKQQQKRGRGAADIAPLRNWNATNCLLLTNSDERGGARPTTAYLAAVYDMLASTLAHAAPGSVRDSTFLFNRKDFPILDAVGNEAYDAIYGPGRPLPDKYRPRGNFGGSKNGTAPGGFIGVCSQSTTDRHADLPLPTADDWADICREAYFADWMSEYREFQCTNPAADSYAAYSAAAAKPWHERRRTVVWRGQNTGCGSTPETNPRMRLAMLSASGEIPGLDAGITRFTNRDKVDPETHTVVPSGSVPVPREIAKPVARLSPVEQLDCRFVLNVEGNSAAYRYGALFGGGQVVINVQSRYKLWFEPLLTELSVTDGRLSPAEIARTVREDDTACVLVVRHDLSDLAQTVRWCMDPTNEAICARLAENARAFHRRVMNKDFVRRYVADVLNGFGARMATYTDEPDIPAANDLALARGQRLRRETLDLPPSAAQLAAWREDQVKDETSSSSSSSNDDRVMGVPRMAEPLDLPLAAVTKAMQFKDDLIESRRLVVVVPFHAASTTDKALATALRARLRACVAHYGAFVNLLVVEQAGTGAFNRGALQNAAVRLMHLTRSGRPERIVFMDADLLLPKALLACVADLPLAEHRVDVVHFGDMVRSMTDSYGDKAARAARDAGRPGARFFLGGALAVTPSALERVNGFPNHFLGTGGGETAALGVRLARAEGGGIPVHRFPQSMPTAGLLGARVDGRRLDALPQIQRNNREAHDLQMDLACAAVNGLNSIQFRLVALEAFPEGRSAFCARVQID